MKCASYFLAFYLILLAIIPCCAFDDCPDDKSMTSEQTGKHEQGDSDCGNCSPFFNCQGCSIATTVNHPVDIGILPLEHRTVFNNYILSPLPHIHYEYWLPPKLG